jgi:pyridoxal phosphate enzyme (YggS family)|tara:strand:- start:72 stop:737 length:666 start_codon:yes stop_codon:yes gene_type:complete
MHNIVNNLLSIQSEIKLKINELNFKNYQPNIVAVSKTFSMQDILPLINHGHIHFGENKVQEAIEKWTNLKNDFKHLKLHMVGKLQTNKVKYVVPLFDYIHSVDNIKLAEKISKEQIKNNKKMKLFIQINIGNEDQKTGISEDRLENFFNICTKELDLNVIGIMCLPPNDNQSSKYFSKMIQLIKKIKLKETSMGMSNDYLDAVSYQSTYLRIGSKIFGERN